MDEQNKNLPNEPQLSGFDSAENINEKREFHPTQMFARQQQTGEGYTVTPTGDRFEPSPAAQNSATQPQQSATQPAQDAEQPAPIAENLAPNAEPAAPAEQPKPEQPQTEQLKQAPFIPNGTYSYSKAQGNIPTAEEPVFSGNQPAEPAPTPVAEPVNFTPYQPQPPKKARRAKKGAGAGTVVLCALLAAVIGAGAGVGGYVTLENKLGENKTSSTISTAENTQQSTANITVDETVNSTVEAVAKKAGPSIIGIRTTAAVTNFFGGSSEQTGEGSGIIYSSDGYIITNYHVIQSAVESTKSKVEVYLPEDSKTAISATVVGYNINYDLAVVKINKTGLTAIEFDDSDKISVGQYAIAIGNPGGLEFMGSVSYGVISGLNRSVATGTGSTMSLIQTDAAINPGNSGGALVNTKGKLIGVNSVKLVNESYEGMGFAIPSNKVKEICDKIIDKQNDPTPYVGIQISQSYTKESLEKLGYPAGAVVVSVVSGGPAEESGIQRGDIITEFNGTAISSYSDFDTAISKCKVGQSVTVKIYRSGRFYSTNLNVKSNNAQ